jgi:phage terminase small subunit
LSELARQHTAAALGVLVDVAKQSESDSARVAAANAILDRGYGKPSQAVKHTGAIGTYDLKNLTDEQLDHLESILGPLALAGGDQGGEGEAEG